MGCRLGGAVLVVRADARFVGMERLRRKLVRYAVRRAFGLPAPIDKGLARKLDKEALTASIDALLARMEKAARAAAKPCLTSQHQSEDGCSHA